MKTITLLMLSLFFLSCSSTRLVEIWKNPEIGIYDPYKVYVIGLTSDEAARHEFETALKRELELRGSEVVMSHDNRDLSNTTGIMTESELEALEAKLLKDGFDTIILTKIIGVENKTRFLLSFKSYDETYRQFKDDYLMYGETYYNPNNIEKYTIYNAETSIYCICPTKARQLIWKGYINIIDPRNIKKNVKDYVKLAIEALEEEQIIAKIE